jgi:hypothetical protein
LTVAKFVTVIFIFISMKKISAVSAIIVLLLLFSCTGQHLINNVSYRVKVDTSFKKAEKMAAARHAELFNVLETNLSLRQEEGLKFLFAFMPLNDLADYDGSFFLDNVNTSLQALDETSWGKTIPEDIFLHYVLPVRVNNENLDSFRIVSYNEIISRVKEMNMLDAALEINHWCHEKVSYQPSDSRTSAPLSTMLSSRGRCGEESTFTVAALRTAGIPARQVYTPRWAHSDDNHAWVEFWADGKWYYMGACEPEAVPDRGWFTEPARRAMLVHTKSFGAPDSSENILNSFEKYSEVNNLAKYAVTKRIIVRCLDTSGNPVRNAAVEYQLYNYAEFYPLATVLTDGQGLSSFETGLGDLLIWGRKNDDFDFRKISVAETDTVQLKLETRSLSDFKQDLDLSVPVKRTPQPGPSSDEAEKNEERLKTENTIRQAYIDSWIKRRDAVMFAETLKMDTADVSGIVMSSMGNYRAIQSFLEQTPDSLKGRALSMLKVISEKDLRDCSDKVLMDHLLHNQHITGLNDSVLFTQYVLNPRIANEMLRPWRSYFHETLSPSLIEEAREKPGVITELIEKSIAVTENENYSKTPLTPSGVWSIRTADPKSRSICFVAICRSIGIPSRLEPGSNVPQYWKDSAWHDVYFSDQKRPSDRKGFMRFITEDKNPVPEYYIHFTIARFENGRYNTLEYNENTKVSDFSELALAPGNYMLVTGNRLNDSKILASISFFKLEEGEHKALEIKLRKDNSATEILGKADLSGIVSSLRSKGLSPGDIVNSGAVFFWIEPDKEPTKHVLNDLPLLKTELESWPGSFIFLNVSSSDAGKLITQEMKKMLPARSFFADDIDSEIMKEVLKENSCSRNSLPLVVFINSKGEILFRSEGYRIGIGEQLLKQISSLR